MSTHKKHLNKDEIYFCTLTCWRWLPLFEKAEAFKSVYNWFNHLNKDGCQLLGYVIMPNHLHCLLAPFNATKPLNKLVGEGKRFMAYSIIQNLKKKEEIELLKILEQGVQSNEKKKGKRHQVFRLSFDARVCFDQNIVEQKLAYIHHNPVSGKWNLVKDFVDYTHSSAAYYLLSKADDYVTHYKDVSL